MARPALEPISAGAPGFGRLHGREASLRSLDDTLRWIAVGRAPGLAAVRSASGRRDAYRNGLLLAAVVTWCAGAIAVAEPPREQVSGFFRRTLFRRGDANTDGKVDLADAVTTLDSLFTGGSPPECKDAADANGDRRLDIADAVTTLRYLFLGLAAPPEPGPDECGLSPREELGCSRYPECAGELPLIFHVLNRVTLGPTPELLEAIQTRAQLRSYLEEQLDQVPPEYEPAAHEPALGAELLALEAAQPPQGPGTARFHLGKLKARLLLSSTRSRWQLLHVLTNFWNNHFHTQVDTLIETFFADAPRGGFAVPSDEEMFAAVDLLPANGRITSVEWNAFRTVHPGAQPWEDFGSESRKDGELTRAEFLSERYVSAWKYSRGGINSAANELENREYDLFRRLALGRFRDLLEASAKSAPMLVYLNGFENTLRSPNENYARELLELHTLGVDNGYTQRDIEELARVFTGWTVDWVARAEYAADDLGFQRRPGSDTFPLNLREPPPFRFPTQQFWDDALFTWAFVVRRQSHDWERKDLFLRRYGGADSLGNPLPPSAEITVPANSSRRTAEAAVEELDRVLDHLLELRDVPKFIATKLIQLFVTDDLALLPRSLPARPEMQAAFLGLDTNRDGVVDLEEWQAPVPLALPNGRPPDVFTRLDQNGDGRLTLREYQEPDLLVACIESWQTTDGSIREVLRVIFESREFFSLEYYRAKVKTPLEIAASARRALGGEASVTELLRTVDDLGQAGMELHSFADPTGESELGSDWISTIGLLERLRHLGRAANPQSGQDRRFSWDAAAPRARWKLDSAERTVDYFALLLLGGDLLPQHRDLAIASYREAPRKQQIQAAVSFLLSLPQFQKQ